MMDVITYIFLNYLCLINLLTFGAMALDKHKAKKAKWRIQERTLMLLCLMGGSIGGYCGMKFLHHKTKKKKFTIGIPMIFFFQICLIVAYVACI